jgi:hypothetical protein
LRDVLSSDVRVALSPDAAYRILVAEGEQVGLLRMLRRPVIVALVIGSVVPIMAVQRMTLGLLVASTISFSFVCIIQLAVATALIGFVRSRRVPAPRAIDLWFAGHVPYSAWLLVMAAVIANLPFAALDLLIASAVIPAAWTAVVVAAFCRNVLGTGRAGARWLAFAHIAAIWGLGFELVALSAGGWFQITRSFTQLFT